MGDVIKLKCYLIKLIEQVKYKIKRSKWGRGEYKSWWSLVDGGGGSEITSDKFMKSFFRTSIISN